MKRVAVKYLDVDVWTNSALRRALKVLERVVDTSDELPVIESVRGELRDLLARRRREGVGRATRFAWERAAEKTEYETRRKTRRMGNDPKGTIGAKNRSDARDARVRMPPPYQHSFYLSRKIDKL
jgi:hypothetical protein